MYRIPFEWPNHNEEIKVDSPRKVQQRCLFAFNCVVAVVSFILDLREVKLLSFIAHVLHRKQNVQSLKNGFNVNHSELFYFHRLCDTRVFRKVKPKKYWMKSSTTQRSYPKRKDRTKNQLV